MPAKTFPLKKLSEIFHDFDSAKDKMLEGDLNLKRSMTISQGLELTLAHHKLYDSKKASTIRTTCDNVLLRNKTL